MNDAYEQWLETQIEGANSEIQQFRNAKEYDAAENSVYARKALEDALRKYQELQVKPIEAPAFRVGDCIELNYKTFAVGTVATIYEYRYVLKLDNGCISLPYKADELKRIEESEGQS
jgi:hypothetical protein